MGRWKKDITEITDGAKYAREWGQTEGGQAYKKQHNVYMREWRKNNPEKARAGKKRAYDRIRIEILTHYSKGTPQCRCCKETEIKFLHIDHINGDGAHHRREIGMAQGIGIQTHKINIGGNGLPYWLKKNGYPEGFQVLCANCNLGKRTGKYCPHELNRGVDMDGNIIPKEYYPAKASYVPRRAKGEARKQADALGISVAAFRARERRARQSLINKTHEN